MKKTAWIFLFFINDSLVTCIERASVRTRALFNSSDSEDTRVFGSDENLDNWGWTSAEPKPVIILKAVLSTLQKFPDRSIKNCTKKKGFFDWDWFFTTNAVEFGWFEALPRDCGGEKVSGPDSEAVCDAFCSWTSPEACTEFPKHGIWIRLVIIDLETMKSSSFYFRPSGRSIYSQTQVSVSLEFFFSLTNESFDSQALDFCVNEQSTVSFDERRSQGHVTFWLCELDNVSHDAVDQTHFGMNGEGVENGHWERSYRPGREGRVILKRRRQRLLRLTLS